MTLRLRSILVYGGLLLAASAAFAQGEYQQAKDGKTLIWNGTPKPGETATWDGGRDKEKYATGFGALTWYTDKGSVYGLYYGNMVHGKFEGPVNLHTNGRTGHAYFVDGGRVTGWAHGPAPSRMAVPEEVILERRKVQAEKEAAALKRTAAAAEAEKKAKIEAETKAEDRGQKSEVSVAEKPAPEVVKKESPAVVAEKQNEIPRTSSPARVFDEPTPIPTKSEVGNRRSESTQLPTPEPPATGSVINEPPHEESPIEAKTETSGRTSEVTRESSPVSTKKESPADISLNALVGPPSSLRATTETSAPKTETETSTSRESAPLTESEAIDLADTEARVQGYHLDDYQRPKVDHSAVKGKWSLFYGLKEGSGAGQDGGALMVTVEDKTKKVEVRK